VRVLSDGWTAVTKDGSLSAHFEHSVAVTARGADILTRTRAMRLEASPGAPGAAHAI
jgi:methionyl aminopeptidase